MPPASPPERGSPKNTPPGAGPRPALLACYQMRKQPSANAPGTVMPEPPPKGAAQSLTSLPPEYLLSHVPCPKCQGRMPLVVYTLCISCGFPKEKGESESNHRKRVAAHLRQHHLRTLVDPYTTVRGITPPPAPTQGCGCTPTPDLEDAGSEPI